MNELNDSANIFVIIIIMGVCQTNRIIILVQKEEEGLCKAFGALCFGIWDLGFGSWGVPQVS